MKTTMRSLPVRVLFTALILSLVFANIAYAGTSSTNGGVGDARCTASKTTTQQTGNWTAYVRSQCDLGIGVIGYRWWTVRQYCVATDRFTIRYQSAVGAVNRNANNYQRAIGGILYAPCSPSIRLENLGRHDFQSITETWLPTVNHYETRP